ncbi:hypothetical protein L6452_42523 [Arctium lappa]|uniref:Uncharacterized protein n=1 Tax=Arctium lappa TaxID=4217 RepID=A0ACB8XIX4_ARCLA|nr:hypothetical protein L6452_42523 [Arctium lappa]
MVSGWWKKVCLIVGRLTTEEKTTTTAGEQEKENENESEKDERVLEQRNKRVLVGDGDSPEITPENMEEEESYNDVIIGLGEKVSGRVCNLEVHNEVGLGQVQEEEKKNRIEKEGDTQNKLGPRNSEEEKIIRPKSQRSNSVEETRGEWGGFDYAKQGERVSNNGDITGIKGKQSKVMKGKSSNLGGEFFRLKKRRDHESWQKQDEFSSHQTIGKGWLNEERITKKSHQRGRIKKQRKDENTQWGGVDFLSNQSNFV